MKRIEENGGDYWEWVPPHDIDRPDRTGSKHRKVRVEGHYHLMTTDGLDLCPFRVTIRPQRYWHEGPAKP